MLAHIAHTDLEAAPPPQPERRSSPRFRTVFFIARISRVSDDGLFIVRNLSDDGVQLVAHIAMHLGERLVIALSEDLTVSGTVMWCDNHFCGVQFDEPIDSSGFLRTLRDRSRTFRRRALRLPVMKLATCYSEAGIHTVRITDVSSRGLGLMHRGQIRPGMVLTLILENGARRKGAVCWSKNGHAGVALGEPFTIQELESARSF